MANATEPAASAAVPLTEGRRGDPVTDKAIPTVAGTTRFAPEGGFGWFVTAVAIAVTFFQAGFSRSLLAAILKEYRTTGLPDPAWLRAAPSVLPLLLAPFTGMILHRFGHRASAPFAYISCVLALALASLAPAGEALTIVLTLLLEFGLALANTVRLDCLKKYFIANRPLVLPFKKASALVGGIISTNWVFRMTDGVGIGGARLVWSAMFCGFLFLAILMLEKPEDHFPGKTGGVLASGTSVSAPASSQAEVESWPAWLPNALKKNKEFGFLADPRFPLAVVISVSLGFGAFCITSIGARRTEGLGIDVDYLPYFASVGEIIACFLYGMLSRYSRVPRYSVYAGSLVSAAVAAGVTFWKEDFMFLCMFSAAGGIANGLLKALPSLVLIESDKASNFLATFNILDMFDGFTKLAYPFLAARL